MCSTPLAIIGLLSAVWTAGAAPLRAQAPDRTGAVFLDLNGNGTRDPGEAGISGVAVSDQVHVAITSTDGSFRLAGGNGNGLVFVSVPDGFRCEGDFWHPVEPGDPSRPLLFPLVRSPSRSEFTFVHASDTHLNQAGLPRTARLRALVDSLRPAFVIITGDLVKDALRVPESEAEGYFRLYLDERGKFSVPVHEAPGNHDLFGIERHLSLVSPRHPLFAKAMYRHFLGPDYYSFNYGGVHFIALNTVDYDDLWYYGHVDATQLAWLEEDLAAVPATTPIVTYDHIPLISTAEFMRGYTDEPPAPTLITVNHKTVFRHTVSNAAEVLARFKGRPYPLALGGHIHMRETVMYQMQGFSTRFEQAAAVTGPSDGWGMIQPSGITVYRVHGGQIDEGRFIPLDPPVSPLP